MTFALQAMPLLDFLVVVVFYVDLLLSSDSTRGFQAWRLIRALRLLALMKMERQTGAFQVIRSVLVLKRYELIATLFMAAVLLLTASTSMYYIEGASQPHKFASIPATMWWSVTAMTTVGYGDIYPVTIPGKCFGSMVAFLGVGLFALPSGIISAGFVEVLGEKRQAETDELADLLDEETDKVERIGKDVEALREAVEVLRKGVESDRALWLEMRRDQKQILALLQGSCSAPSEHACG